MLQGTKIKTDKNEEVTTQKGENWEKKYGQINHVVSDEETIRQIGELYVGGCVCMLRGEGEEDMQVEGEVEGALVANAPIAISCWRGRTNISILVQKAECVHVLERLKSLSDEA
eukprot:TRINITY_DN1527_c0_g1_i5.p4 TRINITY_DN1527_c0_g1~~TRINITY_DN1527_c0_g1_i5.p4  ORF type:complete len:127 (-),score=26.59 TRINITY_DN1527_c0_g1_i5:224-565(-)